MPHRILISGCSSGGKSTLLAALAARGHATVGEPGRRVLRAGGPRPDDDLAGFLEACVALAVEDHRRAEGTVFFDRGLLDALSALDAIGHPGARQRAQLRKTLRYAPVILMAPPWPEIYERDAERTHGLPEAIREYDRLSRDHARAGYRVVAPAPDPGGGACGAGRGACGPRNARLVAGARGRYALGDVMCRRRA
jgi:predicted ATPase